MCDTALQRYSAPARSLILSPARPGTPSFLPVFLHYFCKCQLFVRFCARHFGGNKNEWIPAGATPHRGGGGRRGPFQGVFCCEGRGSAEQGRAAASPRERMWPKLMTGSPSNGRGAQGPQQRVVHGGASECGSRRTLVAGPAWELGGRKNTGKPGSQTLTGLDSYATESVLYLLCQGNPPGASNADVNRCWSSNALAAAGRFAGCWRQTGQRGGLFPAEWERRRRS